MKKVFEKVKEAISVTIVFVTLWIGFYKIASNFFIALAKLIAYIGNKIYRMNHDEDLIDKKIMDKMKFKF